MAHKDSPLEAELRKAGVKPLPRQRKLEKQMKSYMKIFYVLSWIPVALIKLALMLLGLVMVPIALCFKDWPRLLWLWGNEESPRSPQIGMSNFRWLAIRNPVNNMRFIFEDREGHLETNWSSVQPMEAKWLLKVGYAIAFRWTWKGPFAGYRRVWLNGGNRYSEIWFGWKVGSTVPGLGFTMQVRLKREIGT